jgi:hypothetical protein
VRNGTIEMHGKNVGVTWTKLSVTANAGDATITVKDSVSNWPIRGQIAIATTGDYQSMGETETRYITAINGNTITLDSPLKFTHLCVTRRVHDVSVSIVAEVGLLTRNILYQGKEYKILLSSHFLILN